MKKIWTSSALFTSTLAILLLFVLGWQGTDVAQYIALVALGTAGGRAWEAIKIAK